MFKYFDVIFVCFVHLSIVQCSSIVDAIFVCFVHLNIVQCSSILISDVFVVYT